MHCNNDENLIKYKTFSDEIEFTGCINENQFTIHIGTVVQYLIFKLSGNASINKIIR